MPLVTKPYNYANGQTIDANQLNQDLDTLYNLINGLLDAVNIVAGGLNDPNKFAAEVITQAKSKGLVYTQDLYGQSWVVSGGVTTASGSPANQITVTTLIANILQADGSYRHVSVAGTTYVTSVINATYFLELQPDGTINWSQTHSVQANYMPIATVTSNASGNINVITDNRVIAIPLKDTSFTGMINATKTGTTWAYNNAQELLSSTNSPATLGFSGKSPDATVRNASITVGYTNVEGFEFYTGSAAIAPIHVGAITCDTNATIAGALTAGAGGSFLNSTAGVNGYQKLPGGLILQWGSITSVANSSTPITNFPIPFPTICRSLVGTHSANGNTVNVYSLDKVGYAFYCTGATAGAQVYWQAIGY